MSAIGSAYLALAERGSYAACSQIYLGNLILVLNAVVVSGNVAEWCSCGVESVEISVDIDFVFLTDLRIYWHSGSNSICESSRRHSPSVE